MEMVVKHFDELSTKELSEYYSGPDWKADFALDEEGLLPGDLKRGVLSEDGFMIRLSVTEN